MYHIQTRFHPEVGNNPTVVDYELSPHELLGLCVASYAILGDGDGDGDDYLKYISIVNDDTDQSIDCHQAIIKSGSILLSGEEAFELSDPDWIQKLSDLGSEPSKRYTLKIDLPSSSYIVQYNNPEFLEGLKKGFSLLGLDYRNFLFDLHDRTISINEF